MTPFETHFRSRMLSLAAEPKSMFGGTCFMLRGHMLAGTSKRGLLFRIGAAGDAEAANDPAARQMEMQGRTMAGYWFVDEEALEDRAALDAWIDRAVAFNRTLPEKQPKAKNQR